FIVVIRIVNAAVSSTTLFTFQSAEGYRFGNYQHRSEISGQVPARIEQPRAFHAHLCRPAFQRLECPQAPLQIFLIANYSAFVRSRLLQLLSRVIGSFAVGPLEWIEHSARRIFPL